MSEIKLKKFQAQDVRQSFPILQNNMNGKPLVYLDNAATSQKPLAVINAITDYYMNDNANVHRGIYSLSSQATGKYEGARQTIRHFINARKNHEIVFTRSATEAINLVATCFGAIAIKPGDEIIISAMEHHSNLVPWHVLCQQKGAILKVISVDKQGMLDINQFNQLLSKKTKLVALIHVSNVLGTVNPIKTMIAAAHQYHAAVLIDGVQAVPHLPVDVMDLGCDFYVFSGHKMYGPTGVGVLYAKEYWLNAMPPYQTGGDMIRQVSFDHVEYNVLPHKFEAGTPNIAGIIGLEKAIQFILALGYDQIAQHEAALMDYALTRLKDFDGVSIIGKASERSSVISFVMDCAHPHDIATILDQEGIAVRAGHHCAMPLMEIFKVSATVRISFGVYTVKSDIDCLMAGLQKVVKLFGRDIG